MYIYICVCVYGTKLVLIIYDTSYITEYNAVNYSKL